MKDPGSGHGVGRCSFGVWLVVGGAVRLHQESACVVCTAFFLLLLLLLCL
jgi:hypothetical protein